MRLPKGKKNGSLPGVVRDDFIRQDWLDIMYISRLQFDLVKTEANSSTQANL